MQPKLWRHGHDVDQRKSFTKLITTVKQTALRHSLKASDSDVVHTVTPTLEPRKQG